jgi:glycosyltransferase involved in cell wall biosynthesis
MNSTFNITLFSLCFNKVLFSMIFLFSTVQFILLDAGETAGLKTTNEKAIVILVPSYNNQKWYKHNLDSIFAQKYHNFRVIYIDDASIDETGILVKEYIKQKKIEHQFTFIQNKKQEGSLANIYKGVWLCAPNEIIANLDGDDWFAHEYVLQKLNDTYSDPNIWVTYGQFAYYPCETHGWAAEVPKEIIEINAFREYPWVTTALRTFYAGLFQKIKKQDLLYNNEFFPMAGDLAYMWPILEMAGEHSKFIPEVLYIYNVDTPINDIKKNPVLQRDLGFVIRERNKYSPIQSPY